MPVTPVRRSRRQHGRDALVIERCASLIQEALLGQLGRHRPQAHLGRFEGKEDGNSFLRAAKSHSFMFPDRET